MYRSFWLIAFIFWIIPCSLIAQQAVPTASHVDQKEVVDIQQSKMDPEQRLSTMVSKYGKKKGKMIANGRVWPSISYDMARDSWGEPDQIHKSTTHSGSTEKWTYADNRYLFFKNGSLESWKQ